MKTVLKEFSAQYEIKKSNFIAHLVPSSDFITTQKKLQLEHPKSRHIVYALRKLNEFDQVVENSSDDGEPKGTSGPPLLNVLRGYELVNVAVLVVRYFGGIKLGTGGLVRAYSTACNEVIGLSQICDFEKKEQLRVDVVFSSLQFFEYKMEEIGVVIFHKEFGSHGALCHVEVVQSLKEKFDIVIKQLQFEGVHIV